jgi:translocation and assembly module TamB
VAPGFDPLQMSRAAAPAGGPTSEFLRGMQFDVRVRSLASTQFQSGIARDVRVDADLQLRGSLARPYLLGKANVTQGTIELFATRYNVARGELLFYSTSTLAPSIDVDLETRERGVTVSIRLTGQLNKLNVAYRSDPPMQTSDILALLAAGRTPSADDYSLGTTMGTRGPGTVGTTQTGSALVGAALTASLSGRLERFFGSSRIKIDPQRMGVDNVPDARVLLEQSISKDVTITYVTNVRGSQQQVVRLEWNLNKQWSMVAVRDENGVLGLEMLLRKQKK